MNIRWAKGFSVLFSFFVLWAWGQYRPEGVGFWQELKAKRWVNKTYRNLTQDEKLGQLFIVALYTNKGEASIEDVRVLVEEESIGGLILMQDDAVRHIELLNEFQKRSRVPMMVGMDAEWGLYQRIATAHKWPWAITLGAIRDKALITEMASKIAEDAKRMGVNWDFAPVVDVNTNPENPIIGNRSFGSEVDNVTLSAEAYVKGLQQNKVLAAIKHFPGHGDTSVDSHHDLPVVAHSLARLQAVELAPFRRLISGNQGVGGVMVAHLYVPALEKGKDLPASISPSIITGVLKKEMGYKGLIITDALNMGAVAKRYRPGELDAMAFKAGNDLMLFSEGVKEGKRLIQAAIDSKELSPKRLEESVKKVLRTKYFLGLDRYEPRTVENIHKDLNNESHKVLNRKLYANALTLLKDEKKMLPLKADETYYYVPLEEAPHEILAAQLGQGVRLVFRAASEVSTIPEGAKVIVGVHKDNSTAYKSYRISEESKAVLKQLAAKHDVLLTVFGSPYALRDVNLEQCSTVLVAYENNEDAMRAAAGGLLGRTPVKGRLPVSINSEWKAGAGILLGDFVENKMTN
ncbi:glycoside hydrolase family 3 N-terminal domain-containing protein [Bergeyella sp. RCAD1439]|nr:glycoside hydrolase family 3 N-terminal domain-containing protein [Bergeyella sp. RCAD1439]